MDEATARALRLWDEDVTGRGQWLGGPVGSAPHSNGAAELAPSLGGAGGCAPWSRVAGSRTLQSLLVEQVCTLCFPVGQCLWLDSMMGRAEGCTSQLLVVRWGLRLFPNQMVPLARICVQAGLQARF